MARKRYSDEDCLRILRQVELDLAGEADAAKACRTAGISDATYYMRPHHTLGMRPPVPETCLANPQITGT